MYYTIHIATQHLGNVQIRIKYVRCIEFYRKIQRHTNKSLRRRITVKLFSYRTYIDCTHLGVILLKFQS